MTAQPMTATFESYIAGPRGSGLNEAAMRRFAINFGLSLESICVAKRLLRLTVFFKVRGPLPNVQRFRGAISQAVQSANSSMLF